MHKIVFYSSETMYEIEIKIFEINIYYLFWKLERTHQMIAVWTVDFVIKNDGNAQLPTGQRILHAHSKGWFEF